MWFNELTAGEDWHLAPLGEIVVFKGLLSICVFSKNPVKNPVNTGNEH
jgi:hypothetical protein